MNKSDVILDELFSSIGTSSGKNNSRDHSESSTLSDVSDSKDHRSSSKKKKRKKEKKKKKKKRSRDDSESSRKRDRSPEVSDRRNDGLWRPGDDRPKYISKRSPERRDRRRSEYRRREEERPPKRHREDVFWESRWDAMQLQKKADDQERKGKHFLDRGRDYRDSEKTKKDKQRLMKRSSTSPESEELKRLKKLKEIQELVVKEDEKYVAEPQSSKNFEWDNITKMWKKKIIPVPQESDYSADLKKRMEEQFAEGKRKEPIKSEMTLDEIEEKMENIKKEIPEDGEIQEEKEEGEVLSDDEKDKKRRSRDKTSSRHISSSHRQRHSSSYRSSRSHRSDSRPSSRRRTPPSRSSRRRSISRNRHRRRSRSRDDFRGSRSAIDKEKLLAIAKKNAVKLLSSDNLMGMDHDRLVAIKSGGQSLSQLTIFCRELAKKGITDEFSDEDPTSDTEFHHPFMVKDRPIPNPLTFGSSVPKESLNPVAKAAAKSHRMLEFPVSSGNAHRVKESTTPSENPKEAEESSSEIIKSIKEEEEPNKTSSLEETFKEETSELKVNPLGVIMFGGSKNPTTEENKPKESVFEKIEEPSMDIGTIVSQRLSAMRKLSDNPQDPEALQELYSVQKEMSNWAQSKNKPGQFTGHTGAKVLSKGELSTGVQAWARQEQFTSAQKVSGGFGEFMLRKMGWNQGEGLGKDRSGDTDPLTLDIKFDKKGLMSAEEGFMKKKKGSTVLTMTGCKDLSGKHPVSALMELATRRRWGPPNFEEAFECGAPHKKQYIFKVTVNGVVYQPTIACDNKKKAKSDAATFALREMGLLEKDPNNPL